MQELYLKKHYFASIMISTLQDTIVAVATASGQGAIGIVRLSGPLSKHIVQKLFRGKNLQEAKTHTAHFGHFYAEDKSKEDAALIDEVVVTVYHEGRSFTGEESVEIAAHGSPYILSRIVQACIRQGGRAAQPGEFTQRAFLNGRMDLTQAEAVADLIAAESEASHKIALTQMRGGISSELEQLREHLVNLAALLELELDFSDEDVSFADRSELSELVTEIESKIKHLIKSFDYGNAIKKGVPVAIIGKPNAGKSTLLNALLQEERAIVSDIAGTTRDIIEETINLEGITFRFIDTAGIRDTEDEIEAIGVARAKAKVQQAEVVLHLYEEDLSILDELAPLLADKKVFNLRSKADLGTAPIAPPLLKEKYPDFQHFDLSVHRGDNVDLLKKELVKLYQFEGSGEALIISNERHKEALERTLETLQATKTGMAQALSSELLALHLRETLYHLGSITGRIDVDKDILGTIFGKFCIGK